MAFCIITNGKEDNHLFARIMQNMENSILAVDRDYEYIDLHEFDFRRCIRENCINLEADIYSPFGCKKSKKCIKEHNIEVTEKVRALLVECENIVFLLDTSDYGDSLYKFDILFNGLKEKLHYEWSANKLFCQKKALYVVIENGRYSDRCNVDRLRRQKGIVECVDTFFVNERNVGYMLDVLEVAIPSLKYM